MESIPNWYRWLLIVIAALIMCGCRVPLQDPGQPSVPPFTSGSMLTSNVAGPGAKQDMRTNQDAQQFGHVTSDRSQPVSGTSEVTTPNTSLAASAQEWAGRATEFAPVIRMNDQGRLHLQKIESILLGGHNNTGSPAAAVDQTASSTAVYLRDDDRPEATLQTTNAQLDSGVGELESPFTDDPLSPLPSQRPLAPVIKGDSPIGSPSVEHGSPESIVSEGSVVGEVTIDEKLSVIQEPSILGEQRIISGEPETVAEFCPSDCPSEATPECWPTSAPMTPKDLARRYPDEYICDGGDALSRVHVRKDWSLQGLDPEDTVGHYDKLDGGLVVEPSNRVCIYAPRFAAVRKVTAVYEDEKYLQLQLTRRDLLAVTDEAQRIADQFHQNLAAQRHLALQPAVSFKSRQPGVESTQSQALHSLDKELSAHEDLRVMKYGVHKQSEKARLAEFTAKAIAWSHDKAVQVVIDEVIAQTRVTRQGTDEIFSVGDRGPAKFRVIKTASVSDALPGEEVEFTLRFDNVGYQPIGNVTIVDNLTTRLEYIADSQLCSLDADFVNDENQADSLTLRWEIRDPIAPGKGGLIRFRCRVR